MPVRLLGLRLAALLFAAYAHLAANAGDDRRFERAILFRVPEMKLASAIAVEMARHLFLDGYYKAIAFGSGNCKVCAKCNPDCCNFPGKAVPSMEACGIDVYATVRANGYRLEPLRGKTEKAQFFGLLLVE